MATVLVPTPLRRLTGGQAKVEADGSDIGSLIIAVDAQYPGVADRLLDDDGNIKRFINVFVNEDEVRSLQGLHTPVRPQDKVSIVPAMAGGKESDRVRVQSTDVLSSLPSSHTSALEGSAWNA